MFSGNSCNDANSADGTRPPACSPVVEQSSALRMSVTQAAERLARESAWRVLPRLAQLAAYQREDGAYFCAVEDCTAAGPPERGNDQMVTIGTLVFCHAHGKAVHGKLRREYHADARCRWHYLSTTVYFAGQAEEQGAAHVPASVAESEQAKPRRFASADEVAEAILGGHQRVERAGKRPRADGKGQETQCVVAANAPVLCDRWCDWSQMPTASAPSSDGGPPRAHYGFCPECAAVCSKAELNLGPSLREMIVGKPLEAPRAERAKPSGNTGVSASAPDVREHLRRVELAQIFRRATCNMVPTITGDPYDGLDKVPTFEVADFPDHYACDHALDETAEPWWVRVRNHAEPDMTDAEFRRRREAMEKATSQAMKCLLHGPAVGKLAEFRDAVKEYYKERWPKEWDARVARARSHGSSGNSAAASSQICWYCKGPGGSKEYGGMPACTRCKSRLTRPKREARAAARSAADRGAATGGSGSGKKKGGGTKN